MKMHILSCYSALKNKVLPIHIDGSNIVTFFLNTILCTAKFLNQHGKFRLIFSKRKEHYFNCQARVTHLCYIGSLGHPD